MVSDVKKATLSFEARKIAVVQDKNGIVLKIAIHPNECPPDLFLTPLGTRYMVAIAEIGDDEQPVPGRVKKEHDDLIARAGMLPRNERFRMWMVKCGLAKENTEEAVIEGLRENIGVKSRADLANNPEARVLFQELCNEFEDALDEGRA